MKTSGFMPEENYKKVIVVFLYIIIIIFSAYVIFRYLLGIILPFFIAWLFAAALQPVINFIPDKLSKRHQQLCSVKPSATDGKTSSTENNIPSPKKVHGKSAELTRRASCLLFVVLITAAAGMLLFLISNRVIEEVKSLFAFLSENSDAIISSATNFMESLAERFGSKLPFLTDIDSNYIFSVAGDLFSSTLSSISALVPSFIYKFVAIIPQIIFCIFIILFSAYYFSADFQKINSFFSSLLPVRTLRTMSSLKRRIFSTLLKYLRAYLLIMFITFAELLVGFLFLNVEYPVTLALVISFVDVFPVLGVGTVLIPWAVLKLLCAQYYLGFGLLIVYAVVLLVRQIAEPRIIGISIGLYPLATIFAMYAGYKLIGIAGLLFMPVIAILIKSVLLPDKEKDEKKSENGKSVP